MNYGHPRNTGHGRRPPSYEWVPSFSPERRRCRKTSGCFRNGGRGHRPHGHYPREIYFKQSLVPSSFGEGFANVLTGAVGAFIWMHWEIFLAAGLLAILLRFVSRQMKKFERKCIVECEQKYSAYRINRKTSVNHPPKVGTMMAAWEAARESRRGDPNGLAARLRLGAMLSDLETAVDQSYIRDEDGTIVGRRPGLKGWIAENCPDLLSHYKSLMAYKALADKLRVALCIEEPDTLDRVVEMEFTGIDTSNNDNVEEYRKQSKTSVRKEAKQEEGAGGEMPGKGMVSGCLGLRKRLQLQSSREVAVRKAHREMFGSRRPATMAALEAVVRPQLGLTWMRRGRRRPQAA